MADADALKAVEALIAAGDLAAAHDRAVGAIEAGETEPRLKYLAVLALARMGATDEAQAAYDRLDVGAISGVESGALHARLLKDRAIKSGDPSALAEAASAYEQVWENSADPYPAANAATLYAMAGSSEAAQELAIKARHHGSMVAPGDYYGWATRAELDLVLGRNDDAIAALAEADDFAGNDFAARTTTRRQLARLADALSLGDQMRERLLSALRRGTVIHFCGRMFQPDEAAEAAIAQDIRDVLETHDVIAGFGALASGADILVAEELLARGARLNVVLASSPDAFAQTSVVNAGPAWMPRYRACLDAAHAVHVVGEDSFAADPASFGYATEMAMGRALIRAAHIDANLLQIAVEDRVETADGNPAGTQADIDKWGKTGAQSCIIKPEGIRPPELAATWPEAAPLPDRKPLAFLFADFAGFTKIEERALPDFWREVLGAFASCINVAAGHVIARNTWGDACFAVFDDTSAAAECALTLQQTIGARWAVPTVSGMRISLHYGPAFDGFDPVLKARTAFGHEVSRAARIEPITPPGLVYATRNFAAAAALHAPGRYGFGYVGELELPKTFGREALYRVSGG
ncbi:tetratricopeptide repeat-containing protein [Tepidamorphus sp. 3E244]|uniref:tetratricopeptide repeat-containing protein n=1 Tax=Tepidamorphus sp. 3E244 TaxID=3385498 RepID=UPI0038FD3291